MAVKRIRLLGDPILRQRCRKVTNPLAASTRALVRNLRDTLRDFRRKKGFGRGIAAPQIGSGRRIIYIEHGFAGAMINPQIVARSAGTFALWDDCFSFPDLLVRVRRTKSVTVRFTDESGKRTTLTATGSLSELLQHEIDHVDGILAVDRARNVKDIILRSEKRKARV